MNKPSNEFIKGTIITAIEEFSTENGVVNSLKETYEVLSTEDTEAKNQQN
ncbi:MULTISPECIES: hypothetical protein [Bacillaceae]|uniref:Uncharacterized protein n=1 Tax=Evansella alkalicola TaxID=745819 RepID=A0ABS6JV97_9BACI|nr:MULTISPECIES: hypothetical protein [Bacillaceae]MBU9722182.1 hypothetical protein [Bacillus alkalicola]